MTSTRLFYGGWRNGRWSELLLKCQGVVHGAFRQEEANAPRQRALALEERAGPDWRFDASEPSIIQHSTRRSLRYEGSENFTFPPPGIGGQPPTTTTFHRFEYRCEGGTFPLWVTQAPTALFGSSKGLVSWKVSLSDSERYLADPGRSDSLDFRIAMYAFLQDAVLNWPMSELVFGEEHRGLPTFLELWGVRYANQPERPGFVEQILRSSNILRLFEVR